jgi:chromosome segregation ATPase
MCDKGQGTCLCAGCKKHFCFKDFKSHRDMLFNEIEGIIENRNDLQEKINKASQHKDARSPLFAEIDTWQTITIEKVKAAAEQARQQAMKILNSKRTEIKTQFETLSQELIQRKDSENFVEDDIARLKKKIQHLNTDLKSLIQPPAIELHTEQSDQITWNRVIYVENKSVNIAKPSRFSQQSNEPHEVRSSSNYS